MLVLQKLREDIILTNFKLIQRLEIINQRNSQKDKNKNHRKTTCSFIVPLRI